MATLDRYNVRMRSTEQNGSAPAGSGCILSDKGRTAWTLKTARRKMREAALDRRFNDHYDAFEVVPD